MGAVSGYSSRYNLYSLGRGMTGNDLRRERLALGATQQALATAAQMHQPEIARAEARGDAPLRRGTAAMLQAGLDRLRATLPEQKPGR
jgi:transcriptional regulator with XRE-family HTH domain